MASTPLVKEEVASGPADVPSQGTPEERVATDHCSVGSEDSKDSDVSDGSDSSPSQGNRAESILLACRPYGGGFHGFHGFHGFQGQGHHDVRGFHDSHNIAQLSVFDHSEIQPSGTREFASMLLYVTNSFSSPNNRGSLALQHQLGLDANQAQP